jgi:serine/threonine protein phosphatase PrpC
MQTDLFHPLQFGHASRAVSDCFTPESFSLSSEAGARANNEDFCGYQVSPDQHIAIIVLSDGVGGHNCGEVASNMTVEYVLRSFLQRFGGESGALQAADPNEYGEWLGQVISEAHHGIREQAGANSAQEGMGATCVIALLLPGYLVVGHVGDSRAYQFRAGAVRRLTQDDLEVVEKLGISEALAKKHPNGHILSQALGTQDRVRPTMNLYDSASGDEILLCSDGVSEVISEPDLNKMLKSRSPQRAAAIVRAAVEHGSQDNCSVLIVTVP